VTHSALKFHNFRENLGLQMVASSKSIAKWCNNKRQPWMALWLLTWLH